MKKYCVWSRFRKTNEKASWFVHLWIDFCKSFVAPNDDLSARCANRCRSPWTLCDEWWWGNFYDNTQKCSRSCVLSRREVSANFPAKKGAQDYHKLRKWIYSPEWWRKSGQDLLYMIVRVLEVISTSIHLKIFFIYCWFLFFLGNFY